MLLKKIVVQTSGELSRAREQKFLRKMHKSRPQLLVAGPLILHDNARPHIVDVVTKKHSDYGWKVLPHAPYSPDMSASDFGLFPKLKEPMSRQHFSSLEELSTLHKLFNT